MLLLLATFAASCSTPTASGQMVRVIKTNPAELSGITWPASDQLMVTFHGTEMTAARLGTVKLASGALAPLADPPIGDCRQVHVSNPEHGGSASNFATLACVHPLGTGLRDSTVIVLVRPETGEYIERASLGDVAGPPGSIATNPDDTRFVVAMGSLCGVIVEATPDGPLPLDVMVSDGSKSYSLADIAPGPDCQQRGWADWPAWSPDGAEIAFFAAPSAMGLDGPARASAPAGLYVMTPDSRAATRILIDDVVTPRDLAWSPDGRYLAFGGTIGDRTAMWVLEPATGDLQAIHDQSFSWLAWSPDGSQIAGIEPINPDDDPLVDQIVILPFERASERRSQSTPE